MNGSERMSKFGKNQNKKHRLQAIIVSITVITAASPPLLHEIVFYVLYKGDVV